MRKDALAHLVNLVQVVIGKVEWSANLIVPVTQALSRITRVHVVILFCHGLILGGWVLSIWWDWVRCEC